MRMSGRTLVAFQEAKPTVALARFGSFAFSIDTGTPNTAAISSTICSRPIMSFGENDRGLMSMSAVAVRNRPVRRVPRSFESICASSRSISSGDASPLIVSSQSGRALFANQW